MNDRKIGHCWLLLACLQYCCLWSVRIKQRSFPYEWRKLQRDLYEAVISWNLEQVDLGSVMPCCNTPPPSPGYIEAMDAEGDIIYPEEVEEMIDLDAAGNGSDSDDASEADDDALTEYIIEEIDEEEERAACVFTKHSGSVFCCHLDPREASAAVTGGEDDKAYVWDTQTGDVLFECTGHNDSVTYAEFSHDGSYVATGDISGIIKVWKMSSKSVAWEASIGECTWLKWHHGANVLLASTVNGEVFIWRMPNGQCKVLPGHGERVDRHLIMPDGKRCTVGYGDGVIKIYDMKSASLLHQVSLGHESTTITSMDAHSDNNLVMVGVTDGKAILITTQTGKVVSTLNHPSPQEDTASVEAVGFCKDSSLSLAATGTLSGMLYIWEVGRQVPRHVIRLSAGVVYLMWDKSKPQIYIAGLNGFLRIYDAITGLCTLSIHDHIADVLDMCISLNGNTLLSSSDDSTARVFNLNSLLASN